MPHSTSSDSTPYADPPQRGRKRSWHEDLEPEAVDHKACPTCAGTGIKRPRLASIPETIPTTTTPPLRPIDQYKRGTTYYDSGDIVLIFEDLYIYRVHRKRLSRYDGLFRTLFSLPQPEDAELLDGVPFCHVPFISRIDMAHVLEFLYSVVQLVYDREDGRKSYHYRLAVALLRIGTTFDCQYMRRLGIDTLYEMFAPEELGPVQKSRTVPGYLPPWIPVQAVSIAKEYELPILLPRIYYHCAQLSITRIVSGVRGEYEHETEHLPEEDMLRVLLGREKLIFSRRHTTLRLINAFSVDGRERAPVSGCKNERQWGGDTCFGWLMRMQVDFNRNRFAEMDTRVLELMPGDAKDIIESHLCEKCWAYLSASMDEGHDKAREQLPLYFNLPAWAELHEKQNELDEQDIERCIAEDDRGSESESDTD